MTSATTTTTIPDEEPDGPHSNSNSNYLTSYPSAYHGPPLPPIDTGDSDLTARRRWRTRTPNFIDFEQTLNRVRNALHNADMAVSNAAEAFRSSSNQNSVVDLTTLSDQRRVPSLDRTFTHENIFGFNIPIPQTPSRNPELRRPPSLASIRQNLELEHGWTPAVSHQFQQDRDALAVRRQRQQHREWESVQRQNRERAERQARLDTAEEQARNQDTRRVRRRTNSQTSIVSSRGDSDLESLTPSLPSPQPPKMEAIDLTSIDDETSLSKLISQEQQAAIASQKLSSSQQSTSKSTPLSSYKCAICMDTPENVTTTTCGHMFCHQCIVESLKWSERQLQEASHRPPPRNKGLCPVCRTTLDTRVTPNNKSLVVLEIKRMKRSEWEQLQKKKEKGKNKAAVQEGLLDGNTVDNDDNDVADHEFLEKGETSTSKRKRKREPEEIDWDSFLMKSHHADEI